ncbi:hypothetical protein EDD92_3709 [Streptomyces sp. TLI_185]|nr:hypothetical protein EDD92_3709 [Streptomyces sp. TLI_185]
MGAWAAAVRTCVFRPLRPFPSRPWGLRPQTPAFGLNGLVLKRRTGWVAPSGRVGTRTANAPPSNGGRAEEPCQYQLCRSLGDAAGGESDRYRDLAEAAGAFDEDSAHPS